MDDNKVKIRINYQGLTQDKKKDLVPEVITEWNIKRILGAFLCLALIILIAIYFLNSETEHSADVSPENKISELEREIALNEEKTDSENSVPASQVPLKSAEPKNIKQIESVKVIEPVKEIVKQPESKIAPEIPAIVKQSIPENIVEKPDKQARDKKLPEQILNDQRITRALLTTGLDKKEPIDSIKSPVIADVNQAIAVYYFTEITEMKGRTLFHQWYRNDQLVFKKDIKILGNRWRAATSKLIMHSKTGHWKVRLVDDKENLINEIKFDVVAE